MSRVRETKKTANSSNNSVKIEKSSMPTMAENSLENAEEIPVLNIVVNPTDDSQSNNSQNVPLFIKKLWKIVNDEKNKKIISWNDNGDGFIIHNQLKMISETLPKYFKHNQLSSFIRQLNLYDFHKSQAIEKDGNPQFSHAFFLKDLPQLLPVIKRKLPAGRPRSNTNSNSNNTQTEPSVNEEDEHHLNHSSVVEELITTVKEIKEKSDNVATDMVKLRQENAALWSEMNSLRLKYTKQTKIINKLIHFLIAYMQNKHHNPPNSNRTVSAVNSNKYLKTGPKIMEIDYRYKNNPHEFWTDFDSEAKNMGENQEYTVVEPAESNHDNDSNVSNSPQSSSSYLVSSNNMEDILQNSSPLNYDYNTNFPSSSKSSSNSALQISSGSKENMNYNLMDSPRLEINNLKELLKNLSPDDMTNFYKFVNDNNNQKEDDDDFNFETDNEMLALELISPYVGLQKPEENNIGTKPEMNSLEAATNNETTSCMDQLLQGIPEDNLPFEEIIEVENNIQNSATLGLDNDELLNTDDDILNSASVDDFLNNLS